MIVQKIITAFSTELSFQKYASLECSILSNTHTLEPHYKFIFTVRAEKLKDKTGNTQWGNTGGGIQGHNQGPASKNGPATGTKTFVLHDSGHKVL